LAGGAVAEAHGVLAPAGADCRQAAQRCTPGGTGTASAATLSANVEHTLRAQQWRDAAAAVRSRREQAANGTEEVADVFGEDVA
jgi:hypothetical protein